LCLFGFAAAAVTTLSSLLLTLTSLPARGGVAGAGAGDEEASLMGVAAALGALVRAATEGEEILPPWPLLSTGCFIVCVNPRSSLAA
jgi:hypothetical protein